MSAAEMAKGKVVLKVPANTTDPTFNHGMGDFFLSNVLLFTQDADDNNASTVEAYTVTRPNFKVINRDKVQVTIASGTARRWVVISA